MSRLRLPRRDSRHTRLAVEPLEDRRMLSVASFQDGVFPTADYDGTRDVPLFGAEENVNFGDEVTLRADAEQGSTGFPVWSLIKWDLSGIPADSTINDVSITVNVTNTTVAPGFDLFAMRTPWIESEATWIGPTANSTWEEPGVTDPADFNPTVLGTMIGTATGPLTVLFNSAGRAVVAGWLNNPASNHGLLISNPANDNSLRFDSREGTTPANRPKLLIDFTFNDVDPPTATLIDPLDNGPADEDSDVGEVRVGIRDSFVIGLDDFALDDTSVTALALTITRDAAPFSEFTFAFDAATDQITLTPTAGSFDEALYSVTLSGGAALIADQSGNQMPPTTLIIDIDAGLPTTPVAEDDTYETGEDTPLVADAEAGVLDNDFDGNAPGDAVLVTGPANGTLDLSLDGSFTYTPAADFHGVDQFTYRLVTDLFASAPATAQITITSIPDPPIARDDDYRTPTGTLLEVSPAEGVLDNDTSVEGGSLSARVDVGPQHGALELAADGSLSYTPEAGFSGADVFTYIAHDGAADSPPASVTIIVNDPPTTEA
ncbi:MAG: tandem-95 repeat protein, partial [Planctomycetes bacterium]|nr:tandem-95 repeat protein [Planctomycetota bacterium]